MTEFVVQVFAGDALIECKSVQAQTWQEAHEIVQTEYPDAVVSVHSLDVYREVRPVENRPVENRPVPKS